jgi:hypothetical protein
LTTGGLPYWALGHNGNLLIPSDVILAWIAFHSMRSSWKRMAWEHYDCTYSVDRLARQA